MLQAAAGGSKWWRRIIAKGDFLAGLDGVDSAIVEAATGMGMTKMQTLLKIKLPLCKKALISGIRIATVSTIGIGTIAASINAGGLGTILFDGLAYHEHSKNCLGQRFVRCACCPHGRSAWLYREKSVT